MPTETKLLSLYNLKIPHKGPAYLQLASIIKRMIATGEYSQGNRIPSEAIISRSYGVTVMTVRQAFSLLAEQGLLKRVHGRGTFVCGPNWTQSSFNMTGLLEILSDKDNIDIKILNVGIIEAKPRAAAALNLEPGSHIVYLVRLVSCRRRPILLNKAYLIFNPRSPIVESELERSLLFELFSDQGNSVVKKATLKLEPWLLNSKEATFLEMDAAAPAFKICYTSYDYSDSPLGTGWFMTPVKNVTLSAKIGVWEE